MLFFNTMPDSEIIVPSLSSVLRLARMRSEQACPAEDRLSINLGRTSYIQSSIVQIENAVDINTSPQ